MENVPFYLKPTLTTTEKESAVDVNKALQWSYDYDYQYLPEPQATTTVWEDIVAADNKAGQWIWDTAKGTWETTKGAAAAVVSTVGELGGAIGDKAVDTIDSILLRVGLIFVVLVAGVWVLAKTGIIGDAAKIFVATK